MKPGTRNSTADFHMGFRDQTILTLICFLLVYILTRSWTSRKLQTITQSDLSSFYVSEFPLSARLSISLEAYILSTSRYILSSIWQSLVLPVVVGWFHRSPEHEITFLCYLLPLLVVEKLYWCPTHFR